MKVIKLVILIFCLTSVIVTAFLIIKPMKPVPMSEMNELNNCFYLEKILKAQNDFHSKHLRYTSSLIELRNNSPDIIKSVDWDRLDNGERRGYKYTIIADSNSWLCQAIPIKPGLTANRFFAISQDGLLFLGEMHISKFLTEKRNLWP